MSTIKFKTILLMLAPALLLVNSCSSLEVKNKKDKVETVSAGQDILKSGTPAPHPTTTYNPTNQKSPEAVYLLDINLLKDYVVLKRSKMDRSEQQIKLDEFYNLCLGSNAPTIAYIGNKNQIESDRFGKTYLESSHITLESIVVKSNKTKADLEYLANNTKHSDCLESYVDRVIFHNSEIISKASKDALKNYNHNVERKISYKLISFKNNILLTELHATPTINYPGVTIIIATTTIGNLLVQYTANITGADESENEKAVEYAVTQLPTWLSKLKVK